MPYFKVILSGAGISLPFDGGDPVIGFFTTRLVRARDPEQAHGLAKQLVLSEWQTGGVYANVNTGAIPTLVIDETWQVGLLQVILGRSRHGYSFYANDD